MRDRRAGIHLSVNFMVIIIIGFALLLPAISFVKNRLGKGQAKIEEILASAPEPPKPSPSQPITVSAENIKTFPASIEAIKFAVFNPTGEDWIFRDALSGGRCGDDTDSICFLDDSDLTGKCNNYQNAIANDADCAELDGEARLCCKGLDCGDDGICLVNAKDCIIGEDPDCAPQEGVQLSMVCDERLTEKNFKYSTKTIKAGEYGVFHALIEVKDEAPLGKYLCLIKVVGAADKYSKEVVFEIEKP